MRLSLMQLLMMPTIRNVAALIMSIVAVHDQLLLESLLPSRHMTNQRARGVTHGWGPNICSNRYLTFHDRGRASNESANCLVNINLPREANPSFNI
jgi:hypothetical protein